MVLLSFGVRLIDIVDVITISDLLNILSSLTYFK